MSQRLKALTLALGVVLSAGPVRALEPDAAPYVYQIPLEAANTRLPTAGDALRLQLHARDRALLEAYLSKTTVQVDAVAQTSLSVTLNGRDTLSAAPTDRHLAATFITDFDQDSVKRLLQNLDAPGAGLAAVNALSEFVHGRMRSSPYGRGFEAASIVARDLQGDCTEHAVLLTAAARAQGLPARTIVGIVIVRNAGAMRAFGHAWTEVFAGDAWHLADATVSTANAVPIMHYLPIGTLDNEGTGYTLGLYNVINAMPTRVSGVLAVASAATARIAD